MAVKVSVICPTWNRHRLMARCSHGVFHQSLRSFEFIVVDDGSNPKQELAAGPSDVALRVVHHPTNRGAAAARNTGAKLAEGEWLAFIDSDDEWSIYKLAHQLSYAEQHAAALRPQAFVTGFDLIDPFLRQTLRCMPRGAASIEQFCAGCWYCPGSTLLIRRETFLQFGGFDETLPRLEDYEFFLRFGLAGGELLVTPETLSRIHVEAAPGIHRVAFATEYILDKYEQLPGITPRAFASIAAFCRLTRAANYYQHNRLALTAWHLAASMLLSPRRKLQLIDRFETRARIEEPASPSRGGGK